MKKYLVPALEELPENNTLNAYHAVRVVLDTLAVGHVSTVDRYPNQAAFQFFILIMGDKGL